MILIEDFLRGVQIFPYTAFLVPRNCQNPVEVVAHNSGFRRHGAHLLELLQLSQCLFVGVLRQLCLGDAVFEFPHIVFAVFAVAEFLLNGLHLLVQIILALRLLHLALDARADALFDLKHADFAFHQRIDAFQTFGGRGQFEELLLLGNLDVNVAGNRVSEFGRIVDLCDRAQNFRRHFLVELHVAFKLRDDGTRQRFELVVLGLFFFDGFDAGFEELVISHIVFDARAAHAFDQHLDGAVGQFQKLENRADGTDFVDVAGRRIVIGGVLLGDEQNLLLVGHDVFQGAHGFFAADEERHDHVGENDDIAQRQYRQHERPFGPCSIIR